MGLLKSFPVSVRAIRSSSSNLLDWNPEGDWFDLCYGKRLARLATMALRCRF